MLCPVHGVRLQLTESFRKGELLLCRPRGRRAKPHSVTVYYFEDGFQVEVPDDAVFDREDDDESTAV